MLKIFVSSVMEGLEKERQVAEKAIRELILDPDQFEIFPAYPRPPKEICLDRVRECDIFILLLRDRVSEIVLEEFKTAEEHDKEVLIFLKKHPDNKNLKRLLRGIQRDYTYKPFSTVRDFELGLKRSIQYLLVHTFKLLKDVDIEEKGTEILTDETITVGAYMRRWFEYELEEDDVVKGLAREVNNDLFNVYFVDEKSFSSYLNDREFEYHGEEETRSYSLDVEIARDGTYYLVFDTNAILSDRTIRVKIRRTKYV